MKRWLVLPLVLLAAACGKSSNEQRLLSREESLAVTTVPVTASATGDASFQQALMLLPIEAGAVTRIRERNYPNGTRQDIVLGWDASTKSENVLEVSIETASSEGVSPGLLQMGRPSERGIQSEILSRFRGIQMNVVTKPMQNGLGPFGLAIGKQSNGHRCIFAWQWIDNVREAGPNRSSFARFGAVLGGRAAPASIRIRLCSGSKDLDQLASTVEALQMGEPDALARVLMMDRRSIDPVAESAGRGGTTSINALATRVGSLESALNTGRPTAEARQQVAAQPRPARRVARKPRERQEEPREVASPAQPPATTYVPQQPAQPTGPRYLGPVPQQAQGGPSGGAQGSAPSGYAPAMAPQRLNPSLPAQAYRGPTSQEPYRPPNTR